MGKATIFTWNIYLEIQYIWDGTCGYHAIKNTLNLMYLLNEYNNTFTHNYTFKKLLHEDQFINKLNNRDLSGQARNYYIKLNDGHKSTNVNQLKNIINNIDKNNNFYFWDIYEERSELIRLISNNIKGIYGCVIYYEDFFCKHWYGLVIDIQEDVNIHILDSYGIIWPHTKHLHQVLKDLNIKEFEYDNNYSKLLTYSYKVYQLMIFVIVYFIIIYAIIMLYIKIKQ